MVKLLIRFFIKDKDNVKDQEVRKNYGVLCGILGICFNITLFVIKYVAGIISGSIAIEADSLNNLSDAGSSIITLIGFKMSDKKADLEHPFGHGRIEYVSGFIVSIIILLMGIELFKESFYKILHPTEMESSITIIAILIISILIKFYMYCYNKSIGKKIDSSAMKATSLDSISDTVATTAVLISILVNKFLDINIDGISGLFVALFILYSGFNAAKDTINPLLGKAPSRKLIEDINTTILSHEEISGIHDLIVHDYGPGRIIVSLHVEVPGNSDIYKIHDCIDRIESEVEQKLNCECVIHMDPIAVDNKKVMQMRSEVAELVKEYNSKLTIHDFRVVEGPTHTNLIFDVVVPLDIEIPYSDIKSTIKYNIRDKWPKYIAVIKVEKSYI